VNLRPSCLWKILPKPALLAAFAVWCLAAACEKEVDIDLPPSEQKVVVEGSIETGGPPIVLLTSSLSFFGRVDAAAFENAFIRGARVRVSDGTQEITLREYSIDTAGTGRGFVIYTIDTADPPQFFFLGQVEKQYTLTVEYDGKTYTASTKIPASVPLDSVWYQSYASPPDDDADARQVFYRYKDPDTLGNCVRYFTSRNGGGFYSPYAAYTDEVINGGDISNDFEVGIDRFTTPDSVSTGRYFRKGDTVVVKWCAIDKPVYDFWNSFNNAIFSVGNPFAAPSRLATNIRGGALGVWAGYGVQVSSIVLRD